MYVKLTQTRFNRKENYKRTGQPIKLYKRTGQPIVQYKRTGQPILLYKRTGQPILLKHSNYTQTTATCFDWVKQCLECHKDSVHLLYYQPKAK